MSERHELPGGWVWCTLRSISTVQGGYAFESSKYESSGIPIVRISNVKPGGLDWTSVVYWRNDVAPELERFLLAPNDILVSMTGNVGVVARVRDSDLPALLNQRVGRLIFGDHASLTAPYLFIFMQSPAFVEQVRNAAIGMAQPNVSGSKIE